MNQTFDRYLSLVEEALRQALPQPEESSSTGAVGELPSGWGSAWRRASSTRDR